MGLLEEGIEGVDLASRQVNKFMSGYVEAVEGFYDRIFFF